MSFWTGFLVGLGTAYGLGVGAAFALIFWLNRKPKKPSSDWGAVTHYRILDGYGEDFGEQTFEMNGLKMSLDEITIEGTYDDTAKLVPDADPDATYVEVPFSHITNIGRSVKGNG